MEKEEKKKMIYKQSRTIVKSIDEENHTITMYVSTSEVDRDNEIVRADGWVLDNYKKHSPFVDSHSYATVLNQLGTGIDVGVDERGLWVTNKYFVDEGNPKADWAWVLAKHGVAAASVGFLPLSSEDGKDGVRRVYTKQELMEVSQVIVPALPSAVQGNSINGEKDTRDNFALALKEFRGEKKVEEKGVIPYKKYPLADEGATWDAGKEVKQADVSQLKKMCTWYDESKPDVKSSYKLPHHYAKNSMTVWKAVAAAMAALLGARGGVAIPDANRKGVYNHLAKHYKEFDKKVPDFKEYESDEEVFKTCGIKEEVLKKKEEEVKSGRVLSGKSRTVIEEAISMLKKLLELSEPDDKEADSFPSKGRTEQVLESVLKSVLKNKNMEV